MNDLTKRLVPILGLLLLTACSSEQQSSSAENREPIRQIEEIDLSAITEQDLKLGEAVFFRCRTCHTLEAGGRHAVGPNLHGFFGAKAAEKEGFAYSEALMNSNLIWSETTLEVWFQRPGDLVKGTSMAFSGINNPDERRALMAYLKYATQ